MNRNSNQCHGGIAFRLHLVKVDSDSWWICWLDDLILNHSCAEAFWDYSMMYQCVNFRLQFSALQMLVEMFLSCVLWELWMRDFNCNVTITVSLVKLVTQLTGYAWLVFRFLLSLRAQLLSIFDRIELIPHTMTNDFKRNNGRKLSWLNLKPSMSETKIFIDLSSETLDCIL